MVQVQFSNLILPPELLYERRTCIAASTCGKAPEALPVSDVLSCCTA